MSETILAIQLYAELLLNIKSLTLSGTIRSKATQETKATLTTDGSEICVRHEGHEATIRVPAKKLGSAKATLDVPANCTEPINARVQIEGDLSDLITLRDDHSGNISPWSAPSLCTESSVSCAACSAPLIRPRALAQWKDLPSEGWAEMMDFWHCHKPEIGRKPVDDNDLGALKGYGADNKLQAVKGTGLVDQSTFLVSPEDSLAIISVSIPSLSLQFLTLPNHPALPQTPLHKDSGDPRRRRVIVSVLLTQWLRLRYIHPRATTFCTRWNPP